MGAHHKRLIEAVIFDLDDTLIDWAEPQISFPDYIRPRIDRVHCFLVKEGHPLPPADDFFTFLNEAMHQAWDDAKVDWRIKSIGQVMLEAFTDLGLDTSRIDIETVLEVHGGGVYPGVVLFDDTLDVLGELRRRGYKIGLLTNSFMPMWMRDPELEAYQLMEYLDARIASGDIGYLKPHPAIYHEILARLGTRPERAVFVGDRPVNDIAGANATGLISVLINPPHLDRDLNGVVPDYTINCLSQLLTILERLETT
jgi:putative hydrolase of the HAD superfamily